MGYTLLISENEIEQRYATFVTNNKDSAQVVVVDIGYLCYGREKMLFIQLVLNSTSTGDSKEQLDIS